MLRKMADNPGLCGLRDVFLMPWDSPPSVQERKQARQLWLQQKLPSCMETSKDFVSNPQDIS